MNLKTFLPACLLMLAVLLSGCGATAPAETNTQPPQNSESSAAVEGPAAAALLAYRELLLAAPAIDGEHLELEDASFGYEQNLQKFGPHYDSFALTDLDGNGIPELIALSTINFRWTPVSVFTFTEGTAVLLKDPLDPGAHGTFEQNSSANGAFSTYICAQNHIHSVWRGETPIGAQEENHAYALTGTTLTAVDCTAAEDEDILNFYAMAQANTAEGRSFEEYTSQW